VVHSHQAGAIIDADEGLAFPACDLAISEAIARARTYSISFCGVTRSHHFGVAGVHLEAVARAGMVGLAFTNSPAAIAAWGGARPLFGTNPIAAIFPRHGTDPILIDLSLSKVARGKLMIAAKQGQSIPGGWALDRDGHETTNPRAGLEGTMYPLGGVKGALLAMVVELLCVTLTGAALGFEADSFFQETGNRPHLGHAFIAIDPAGLAGARVYREKVEELVAAMMSDESVRLPGARRFQLARQAALSGVDIPDVLAHELLAA
jgi:(2R)-3-sulfolactate dehydrogenase (NADP+)